MLALTVHPGDYIAIGPDIVIQVLKAGDTFRIAIDAPRDLAIQRDKVLERTNQLPQAIQRVRSRPAPSKAPGFKRPAETSADPALK